MAARGGRSAPAATAPGRGIGDRVREHPELEALETSPCRTGRCRVAVSGQRPDLGQPSEFRTKTGQRREGDRQVAHGTVIALPAANHFA